MPNMNVSYTIARKAGLRHFELDRPTDYVDLTELVRLIVKHEFPQDPDPYLSGRSNARTRAIVKYGISHLKVTGPVPKKRRWKLVTS